MSSITNKALIETGISWTMLHCDLFVSHTILADMLSGVSSPASSPPSSTEQNFVQSSRSGLLLVVVLVASRSTLVKYYITNVSFNPNYHPISDIQTLTVLTFNSKVASSSATMIDRGCCCKHERVHMWLTPPSIAFCKATALLAPVAMMTTSLAWFCRQYIVTDQHKRNIMGVVTNLHDGLNSHRQRHLGYSMQVSPEKPSIRSHRLFRQSLHSCPRHHAGPGLVESDMSICANSSEEQIDPADVFDLGFECGALGLEIRRVTVEDVHVFAWDVDM